ncbi:MAG TPA: hypothetical protein VKD28_09870 [Gemmatimonadales bacterium]|nr:hypothetical protein [Gemmatimonadales bacterium]
MAADSEPWKRRRAWRTGVGAVLTLAWILFWVLAVWGDFAASALVKGTTTLTFSEWGAFVAGVAAPIAFLWLIVGYFQQGDGLARNTEALRAQEEQLRLQVQETAALVREHARQAAASAQLAELEVAAYRRHEGARRALLAPNFRVTSASYSAGHDLTSLQMVNTGGAAHALKFRSDDFAEGHIKPAEIIERNGRFTLYVSLDRLLHPKRSTFAISCKDIEGGDHAFAFRNENGEVVPLELPPRHP